MFFSRLAIPAALAALFSVVDAQTSTGGLTILSPGGPDLWWVASSINTLSWTCKTSTFSNFTVLIGNTAANAPPPQPIISQENNFDCSRTISQDLLNNAPGTGYFVQLSDPFNSTNVYAQSAEFEIKAVGSTYPDPSSTPTAGGGAAAATSGGPSGSGSGTSGTPTSTGSSSSSSSAAPTQTQNSAAGMKASLTGLAAVAAAVFGIVLA